MRVILLAEARRRLDEEAAWWREHRDAKDLFLDEVARGLELLSTAPDVGQRYRESRGKTIRRLYLRRIQCHLYYWYDGARDVIEIHSLWGSQRGRGPDL